MDSLDAYNDHYTQAVDEKGLTDILDQISDEQVSAGTVTMDSKVKAIIDGVSCSELLGQRVHIEGVDDLFENADHQDPASLDDQQLSASFLETVSLQTFLTIEQLRFLGAIPTQDSKHADLLIGSGNPKSTKTMSHQQLRRIIKSQQKKI